MASLAARWVLPSPLSSSEEALEPLERILLRRGLSEAETRRAYLDPTLDQLHSPGLMLGMASAVARVQQALLRNEAILLYGDYDVDGTSAIVILKTVLDLAGARVSCFIPHRLRDGYGMKADRIEAAAREGIRLIISVDTGIRASEVVALAGTLDIDVIVTDHHLPEAAIPPAVAVLNPNQPGCPYPNKHLCGAGVALQLAHALMEAFGWNEAKRERTLLSLLKIAALATVADIVPLLGENRAIVKLGLEGLAEVKNPGLRALLDVAGIAPGTAPTARQVGFQLGPRINAAGRMDSAQQILDLFFTKDPGEAQAIAQSLDEFNRERQQTEEAIRESIFAELEADPARENEVGLVLYGEDWHLGVAGIVAGRIAEKQRKPTFVLSRQEGFAKGSGRSLPGFHLLEALESMAELFTAFGGHEQAAGLTLPLENIAVFRQRFAAYAAARLDEEARRPVLRIEEVLRVPQVNGRLFTSINAMAPFGHSNEPPLFAVLGVEVAAPPYIMKEKHVKLSLRQDGEKLSAKGWFLAEGLRHLQVGQRLDVAFRLEADSWDGWSATIQATRVHG
jgi:single-stranded-DNA-specific exonuclease